MRIALDAMGGDHAPGPIVQGAIQAAQKDPEMHVVLVGDQAQIEPLLASAGEVRSRLEVFHATQVITMEESPGLAFRKKPDNSITRCWQLMQQKRVEAIVGAGNTGAMVAGGFLLRLFLKGVRRPGIAALMPTFQDLSVLLDVGANVHPKPEHLYQYGVMGAIYAKHILKRDKPKIGLLNVGSEEDKGNELAKDTQELFRNGPLKDQFIGNIEGRDVNKGICDVIVADGFVGNIVLKVCEGVFDFVMKVVGKEIFGALKTELPLAQQALGSIVKRYDYHELGGAPLLGVDGICIICHGSSKERAIENALHLAAKHARAKLNELIVAELAAISPRKAIPFSRHAEGVRSFGVPNHCREPPMETHVVSELAFQRMVTAVEKVRDRLRRTAAALEQAQIPYAVIGGNAVAAWVSEVDEAAVRNTQDVDILLRREDLERAKVALGKAGFIYRHAASIDMFLDGPGAKARDAVHVIFANEKVREEYLLPAPDVSEVQTTFSFRALSLEALLRMKLTSNRRKDQVHVQDLIDVGLIDAAWSDKLPAQLAERLQAILNDPDG